MGYQETADDEKDFDTKAHSLDRRHNPLRRIRTGQKWQLAPWTQLTLAYHQCRDMVVLYRCIGTGIQG